MAREFQRFWWAPGTRHSVPNASLANCVVLHGIAMPVWPWLHVTHGVRGARVLAAAGQVVRLKAGCGGWCSEVWLSLPQNALRLPCKGGSHLVHRLPYLGTEVNVARVWPRGARASDLLCVGGRQPHAHVAPSGPRMLGTLSSGGRFGGLDRKRHRHEPSGGDKLWRPPPLP